MVKTELFMKKKVYKEHLNDNLKYDLKSRLLFISPERVNIIAEARMFFLILLSCYSLYIITPWYKRVSASSKEVRLLFRICSPYFFLLFIM